MTNHYKLWAMCNAKDIDEATFLQKVGVPFMEFYNRPLDKKLCMKAWNEYTKENSVKKRELRKSGCVCDIEVKLEPNATQGPEKILIRLWYCPVHKNTSTSILKK